MPDNKLLLIDATVAINTKGNHIVTNASSGCHATSLANWRQKQFLLPVINIRHNTNACRCLASGGENIESLFLHGKILVKQGKMDAEMLGLLVTKLVLRLAVPEELKVPVVLKMGKKRKTAARGDEENEDEES